MICGVPYLSDDRVHLVIILTKFNIFTIIMTRLKFLFLFIITSLSMSLWAVNSTDVQMQATAKRVLKSSRPVEQVAYYPGMAVYRQAGGEFAVISNNRETPTVLAYSHSGDLDLSHNNPGFNWWLNATRKVMIQSVPLRETTKPDPNRFPTSVQPLLTSAWG